MTFLILLQINGHPKKLSQTPEQRARHGRDLLWMGGVIVGLIVPVALGVYIVFNLTCMRNPVGAAGANMYQVGGNYDLWQQNY